MTTKITKRDNYDVLTNLIAAARDAEIEGFDYDSLETFIEKEVEGLDKKAEQARARAAKRKSEGDELRETIYGVLTDEPQILPDILEQTKAATGDETLSAQKIAARLKQLVDLERAGRCEVSVPDADGAKARKLVAYTVL